MLFISESKKLELFIFYLIMQINKDDLKNKIIYRASYRGTKEMDILMIGFVKSIIDKLDIEHLKALNEFVNMDDELLVSIKKKDALINNKGTLIIKIADKFQKF
tara:strand:- start:38 stop:349 length:312 start_codon:yes stop_codon:yes gene_type:complete